MPTNNNQIDKDNSAKTQNVAKLNLTRFFFLSIIQNMIDIENILRGKAMLESELAAKNIAPSDWMNDEMLPHILKRLSI